ncbi:MAG: substrate-binding domain-containing protein [Planctomycetaceae bacterium]|jgi:ribose transport system substrate-binding protein|nr:substrate-binding domain-containing protein [Planctomycetaceae bacterium]
MNRITFLSLSAVVLASASSLFGLSAAEPSAPAPIVQQAAKPKIGVSIPAADHGWTAGVVWWARECEKLHPEIEWTIVTAETPEKQIEQMEALMAKKVDGLVVLATESAPITPVAEEAHNRGILIVNVDRGFLKPVADIFIEGDNKAFGRKSAEFMVQKLGGKGKAKGNLIILEGIPCTVNTDRVNAAMEIFKAEPGIKIVGQQAANWNRQKALEVTETLLTKAPNVTAIWASDDDMALGAEQALAEKGIEGVWILGGAGMKDIIKRVMDKDPMYPADITYPPSMIATGMELAATVLKDGKKAEKLQYMPKHLMIDVDLVTPENAKQYYFPKSVY